MSLRELAVTQCGAPAGCLAELAGGEWRFSYAETAFDDIRRPPVSLALPRARAVHQGEVVRSVFKALLPDGALQGRLARSLGVSESNHFDLLARVAGECHGGLRIEIPPGEAIASGEPRILKGRDLRHAMNALLVHPLLASAEGVRKTLPGEFDKMAVQRDKGEFHVVFDRDLTTHILKPARPGLRESVYNEGFCMALAAAAGLPVAASEIVGTGVSILAVERIDRRVGEHVMPCHMEDFCQAGAYAPERPYEREGGPRLSDIAATVRAVSRAPAADLKQLLRWVVFGFMVGFGAGHARQLALLLEPDGCRLAPFFGLWSTHVYPEMSYRFGFRIGTEDRPDWISAMRWRDCAAELGIRPQFLVDEVAAQARHLPQLAREVSADFQRRHGLVDVVSRITALIEQRARQSLVSVEAERNFPDSAGSA